MSELSADTRRPARRFPEEQRRALGTRIMELRRSRRWSQRELARRSGIGHVRLSKLENGHATPNLPELLRLAEALDSGLDDLVRGSGGSALAADAAAPETVLCAIHGAVRFVQTFLEAAGAFGARLSWVICTPDAGSWTLAFGEHLFEVAIAGDRFSVRFLGRQA
ncbi:MAG TPA: helix-turn-helix transcriptional regulator [Thermoanaerobaculia bacterium]|nr:helix-turn-helix transcriptional regulator [Thermoanaerobaculia bacterium]